MNKELLDEEFANEMASMLIEFNRYCLNQKEHIKKYNRLRHMHSEIINNMFDYVSSSKYINDEYEKIMKKIFKEEMGHFSILLDSNDEDDLSIINEIDFYKNHKDLPSVTEIFLVNKKFRNKDKIKFLEAMNDSYASLFKVIKVDREDGYVWLKDVFTNKEFKIIDIAMSSTLIIEEEKMLYVYNRIITVDDISFGTGIHCRFFENNKYLQEFIKKHDFKNSSNLEKCFRLYKIFKEHGDGIKVNVNTRY